LDVYTSGPCRDHQLVTLFRYSGVDVYATKGRRSVTGQWFKSLEDAEAAEHSGNFGKAELYFDHAIYEAQAQGGYVSAGLAVCLMAFAKFLENRNRFSDAMFRYKLAAVMQRQLGNKLACAEAEQSVLRMQHCTCLDDHDANRTKGGIA
jgi:hypothetical protein